MERLKQNPIFPKWVPRELREYIYIKTDIRTFKIESAVEMRLLTDPRMKPVWELFEKKLPSIGRKKSMIDFLEIISVARLDAEEMRLTRIDQEKIKRFKKQVRNRTEKLIEITRKVDEFCTGPETKKLVPRSMLAGKNSYETQLRQIEEKLITQLEYYNRSTLPRIHFFIPKSDLDEILTIKKRGQSNFVEIFTREVASVLFVKLFSQPYSALAEDVSLVMGKIPTEKNISRKQQQDRTRKRRENQRRGNI